MCVSADGFDGRKCVCAFVVCFSYVEGNFAFRMGISWKWLEDGKWLWDGFVDNFIGFKFRVNIFCVRRLVFELYKKKVKSDIS